MKNFYHEPYEHNELTLRYLHLKHKKSLINYNNFMGIKKRNRTTGSYWLVLFVVSIFLLTSCPEPFTPDNIDLPEGKGSFSLSLSSARTILPTAPSLDDFVNYTLAFNATTGGEDETVNRTNATLLSDPIILYAGTYSLTVTAYKAGDLIAARGTAANIVIVPGQNNTASVTLHALLDEPGTEGTFKWDITLNTLPVTVSSAVMKIFNSGGTQQGAAVNLSASGTTSGQRTLASGMYTVSFDLEGTEEGENKNVKWDELLYVYATLESGFAFTFTDEHFKKINWKVTLDNNFEGGGSVTQSVMHGGTISRPTTDPQRAKYDFIDWYTTSAAFTTPYNFTSPVMNDFTLFAGWDLSPVVTVTAGGVTTSYNDLTAALNAITIAGDYAVTLKENQTYGARTLTTTGINITIAGEGSEKTITYTGAAASSMFTLNAANVNLTLDNNITINGIDNGTGSLITVTNGTLTMRNGSKITGYNTSSANGAVNINGANAHLIMEGGTITGNNTAAAATNTLANGGATLNQGRITMSAGSITNNFQQRGTADETQADVYVTLTTADASIITLSGSASIGSLKLNPASVTVHPSIYISGAWSGNIGMLNLRRNVAAMNDVILAWTGKLILQAASPYTLSASDINGITALGNFISSATSNNTQAISPTYLIADFGEYIGKLIKTPAISIPGTIVVDMYDSRDDGWDGIGKIDILINGVLTHSNIRVFGNRTSPASSSSANTPVPNGTQTNSNRFTFTVSAGDMVEFVGTTGTADDENSFIVYHEDTPPNPAFPAHASSWSGDNALLFKLTTITMQSASGFIIIDSGNDARPPIINTQPSNIFHYFYGAAPQPVLSVAAVSLDGGTLSYQWYSNTIDSTTGGTAVGTNSNTYSPDVSTLGTMFYYCVITNTNPAAPGNTTATRTTNVARVRVSDSAAPLTLNGNAFDNLNAVFASIGTTAGTYNILIDENQTLAARTISSGVNITIASATPSSPSEVQLTGTGSMFTVNSGASLTLEDVVLKGVSSNTNALVTVSGGTITMQTGSEITVNTNTSSLQVGGGVTMSSGTFNLNGGKIHSNTRTGSYGDGGGVILTGGTFNLNNGEISNNQAQMHGGGVYIRGTGAILNMSGGSISNNRGLSSTEGGGGIWMMSGIFNMTGGVMSGNTTAGRGGAVYVYSGTFTKTGSSIIYGNNEGTNSNTANILTSSGHAVFVSTTRFRNTTAGEGVNLDSGTAVNWE